MEVAKQLLRTASIADRIDKVFQRTNLPQNRWGRRRMDRYLKGHTPGPFHRQLKTRRNRCQVEIRYPNGRAMVCNELLPTYRDQCLWHEAAPLYDEASFFSRGKQGSARRTIAAARV